MSGIISDNVGRATGLIKAAGGGGKIGQVVQTVITDTVTTTSGGSSAPLVFVALTGMTVDITPTATSSKVLVMVSLWISNSANDFFTNYQLFRDSTQILLGDAAGDRARVSGGARQQSIAHIESGSNIYLDSPSSTSSVTYFIKWATEINGTGVFNRSGTDSDLLLFPRTASSITVMEVLA